jgi:hypothetical protein
MASSKFKRDHELTRIFANPAKLRGKSHDQPDFEKALRAMSVFQDRLKSFTYTRFVCITSRSVRDVSPCEIFLTSSVKTFLEENPL